MWLWCTRCALAFRQVLYMWPDDHGIENLDCHCPRCGARARVERA